ncbi:MAG: SDR family oxidoreductase [Betaproteobacteria bacterium]|nr:SDR family oxidoreductase [Betaproteobacteria bacterium]
METSEGLPERIKARSRTWLVTGAAGFIGSHLAEALLRAGQKVVGLDNFSTGRRENLLLVRDSLDERQWRNFRFIQGDIRSLETCREACRSVELVLHEAALGSVPRSIDDPVASMESNVNGFLNMLVAARDAGVERLVYASSSATYGDHPALPKVEQVIGKPMSPYGMTKYVNELTASVFSTCYGFDTIGLRYFNVFGPRQDPNGAYAAVIPAFIGGLVLGKPIYIYGDGGAARDFCYVENIVQANLLAAVTTRAEALNEVYNVACGAQTSLLELFETIRGIVGARLPRARTARPVHRETRRGDIKLSLADISKASRLLGYEPKWRVAEGLEKTVDWYIANLQPVAEKKVAHA